MMGQLPPDQNALFYDFCLEKYVPPDHLLRKIDHVLDLNNLREHLQDEANRLREEADEEMPIGLSASKPNDPFRAPFM